MPRPLTIGGIMSLLDDILAHNREYVEDQNTGYVIQIQSVVKCLVVKWQLLHVWIHVLLTS